MSIVISDKLGNSLLVNLHKSKHLGIKRQKAPALDMICRSQGTDSAISEQYRLFVADNFTEVSLQRSSSYQTAVDVSLGEKLRRVSCVYGTAVLDTDRLRRRLVVNLSDTLPQPALW